MRVRGRGREWEGSWRSWMCAGLLGLLLSPVVAAAPILLTLEPAAEAKIIKIETTAGAHESKERGAAAKWKVLPGDALGTAERPAPRVVELYGGQGADRALVCRIVVAYFKNDRDRWAPHFRLDEEPLVIRDGNRFKPLLTVRGMPTLLVQSGGALPNAEGYAPTLEFGLTTGPLAIDFWIVQ